MDLFSMGEKGGGGEGEGWDGAESSCLASELDGTVLTLSFVFFD